MPPVPLAYTPSQLHIHKDDAMQHDTAALHPAAREKLLERWLWTEESMGSTTAREGKPPSPLNYPHCMAKDHSHCCQEEPKGMAAP